MKLFTWGKSVVLTACNLGGESQKRWDGASFSVRAQLLIYVRLETSGRDFES